MNIPRKELDRTKRNGTQAKMVLSEPKLATEGKLSSQEPLLWNVREGVREHFRHVRSTLNLANREGSLCVAVCSTSRGEGVSWVTAMLSCAIAEEGEQVFLIDGNRTHPSQNKIFGVEKIPGAVVTQSEPVELVSRRASRFDISILTMDANSANTQDVGLALREALPKLRQKDKVILIDCEPMRDSSHLLDMASAIDGVIFVVEAERERREVIARNLESIRRSGLRIFGIVLNKRTRYIPGWLYRAL